MNKKKIIVIGIVLLVIVAGCMYGVRVYRARKAATGPRPGGQQVNEEMTTVMGIVQGVSGNEISIVVDPSANPTAEKLGTKIAVVNSDTKILLIKQRDPKAYQEEAKRYTELVRNPNGAEKLPEPPRQIDGPTEIGLDGVKQNQQIMVLTGEGDLRGKDKFVASSVTVRELFRNPGIAPLQPVLEGNAKESGNSVAPSGNVK